MPQGRRYQARRLRWHVAWDLQRQVIQVVMLHRSLSHLDQAVCVSDEVLLGGHRPCCGLRRLDGAERRPKEGEGKKENHPSGVHHQITASGISEARAPAHEADHWSGLSRDGQSQKRAAQRALEYALNACCSLPHRLERAFGSASAMNQSQPMPVRVSLRPACSCAVARPRACEGLLTSPLTARRQREGPGSSMGPASTPLRQGAPG